MKTAALIFSLLFLNSNNSFADSNIDFGLSVGNKINLSNISVRTIKDFQGFHASFIKGEQFDVETSNWYQTRCNLHVSMLNLQIPGNIINSMEATVTNVTLEKDHSKHYNQVSLEFNVNSVNGATPNNTILTVNCQLGPSGLFHDISINNVIHSLGSSRMNIQE